MPSLCVRRVKLSMQYASKSKLLPKHPTHDTYMKLFDAKQNTFGLSIKQFLTAYNIDFSNYLETPLYFVLPPWCIKSQTWCAFISFLFLQMATVFHSDTVISTRLPDPASIFTSGIWAIIKDLEQIMDSF